MTVFEYLSVLFSIVLGLALTNLLGAVAHLMHVRKRLVPYAPALIWAALIFVIIVQHWWAEFGLRNQRDWSFAGYVAVLMTPITLYLLSALVLPRRTRDEAVDLRAWYYENRRWFYALVFSLAVWSFAEQVILNGGVHLRPAEVGFLCFFAGLSAVGFLTERPRVHEAFAAIAAIGIAAFVALLYPTLG